VIFWHFRNAKSLKSQHQTHSFSRFSLKKHFFFYPYWGAKQTLRGSNNIFMWIPVNSTGKVFCRQARDLGLNPAYTKNQLVS
jgi:hypothetical protein